MNVVGRRHGRAQPRVLITGGCGFIGSNLANLLAQRGQGVIAFDALSRAGAQENAAWLKARWKDRIGIVTGDVRDAEVVRDVVRDASAVLHLAAQVAVTTSLEDPLGDFSINAAGTLNVLEAVRRENPAAPVVFASTNKVYGKLMRDDEFAMRGDRYAPRDERLAAGIGEATPIDFYSPYGCSKGAADQYVRDYARVFGLRSAVLRMSCIYGPRQFGTEDQGWIAHFLIQAIQGKPITIYGDGRQVRDALYVEDAAAAWLAALDNIDKVRGRVFNLGGGPENAVSLRECLDMIGTLHGRSPHLRFGGWRPGDQPWYVSDIRAISAALGWAPRVPFRDGLARLDRWIADRFATPHLQEASA